VVPLATRSPSASGRGFDSEKVATWASLFQDGSEYKKMGDSEWGSYSCSKLLKDMEALENDEDEDV
jgi:hypothetical protein